MGKNLVDNLVALFKETKQADIDEAVAKAKNQLATGNKEARSCEFEKLFDVQITTLKDRGVPEQIVEMLAGQKGNVLKRVSEMMIGEGNTPFLPVIPRSFRSPYDLMAMVRNGKRAGYTYLNPNLLSDTVTVPQEPYYIYDIEDGQATLDKSPKEAEKILKQQKRSPLTAAEVMALAVHRDVLSHHYMWATGSRCESAGGVPNVFLDVSVQPRLDWGGVDDSYGHGGSPSCGSR